jgi:hypothetical protein
MGNILIFEKGNYVLRKEGLWLTQLIIVNSKPNH